MFVIGYLLCLIIAYFFWRRPIVGVLLYGLFAADRDGYAMQQFLMYATPQYKLLTRVLFLIGFLYACFKIFHLTMLRRLSKLEMFSALAAIVLVMWMFFGGLIKGNGLLLSLSHVAYSGIPAFLVFIAFWKDGQSHTYLRRFIIAQAILAACVLLFPFMSFLDGFAYKAMEGFSTTAASGSIESYTDLGTIRKGELGRYGQFHNPNALGLYSAAIIALSLGELLDARNGRTFAAAGALMLVGIFGWFNSFTRGPIILIVLGFIIILLAKARGQMAVLKFIVGIILSSVIILVFYGIGLFEFLFPRADDISVSARLDGYRYGLEAIVSHPFFGVDSNWSWWRDYPHFLSLAVAADHGIVAGGLVTLLVFVLGGMVLARLLKLAGDPISAGCFMLTAAVFGIAVTNNFTAPVLFWSILATSLMVSGNKRNKRMGRGEGKYV